MENLSLYENLFDILKEAIYGTAELSSTAQLSLDLVCTTLAFVTTLVPFLVVGAMFIWIFKRL